MCARHFRKMARQKMHVISNGSPHEKTFAVPSRVPSAHTLVKSAYEASVNGLLDRGTVVTELSQLDAPLSPGEGGAGCASPTVVYYAAGLSDPGTLQTPWAVHILFIFVLFSSFFRVRFTALPPSPTEKGRGHLRGGGSNAPHRLLFGE